MGTPTDREKSSGDDPARQERAARWNRDLLDEVIDEAFEEPYDDGGYTEADLAVLADEAADRYYDRD